MATTTTDDILMFYGDGAEGVFETQQTCVRTSQALAIYGMLDRRTQYHPLSATIDNRRSAERHAGPSSMLQPGVAVGEQDSAADG